MTDIQSGCADQSNSFSDDGAGTKTCAFCGHFHTPEECSLKFFYTAAVNPESEQFFAKRCTFEEGVCVAEKERQ
eukprot:3158968-Pleurochrysis_carterae.AAC.1